ncbi:MAG: ABC transporter substrate-binding protein, partial [Alphaproteobacteria bacterium]
MPAGTSIGRMLPMVTGKVKYGFLGNEAFFSAEGSYDYAAEQWGPQDVRVLLGRVATVGLAAAGDSGIKSIADMKGKRIGFSVGGLEDALLGSVLANHGLSMKDVTLVNVNWSLSPSLIAGKVDAVIGAYRNFELNQMDIVGHPGRAFYLEEEGVPAYDELIVVAHKDKLADPRFKAFNDAIERGVQYIINHPDDAWKLFISGKRKELDDELNRRAWRDTLARFALRPAALDVGRYERFAQFLAERDLIKSPPAVGIYAV